MKKMLFHYVFFFIGFISAGKIFAEPAITEIILPKYIQGLNGTNNNRVPFVFRAKIDGLNANSTYRYINQVVTSTDGATTNGAGNCIFVNPDFSFTRSSGPSFSTLGNYGEFTTDDSGSFTGWFITEPTGNNRFVPGNFVFMRLRLNDGAGGTTAVTYLTLPDSIRVIDFGTSSSDSLGTAIFGRSLADSKDFVLLYDNADGTGRPVAGTIIENDGLNLSSVTSYALFYRDSVDGNDGSWGTIIPNVLSSGIQRIERRLLADGSIYSVVATDLDGIWPSGANTVNPASGLNPITITSSDAIIPVELTSFSISSDGVNINLSWLTATETNNMGFEIQRKFGNNDFENVGFIQGAGTTSEKQSYQFTDKVNSTGIYVYRLKQIDFNGSYHYSKSVEVRYSTLSAEFTLAQNYPNPFNPNTTISFTIDEPGYYSLKVFNVLGQEINTLVFGYFQAGTFNTNFDAMELSSGIYIYQLSGNNKVSTKKMILVR